MDSLRLSPEQMICLGQLADNGAGQVVALGLPDRIAPVVVHFDDCSVVIEEDGGLIRTGYPQLREAS